MKTITTDELQKRVEAGEVVNIIDVREPDEVATGMIPGAKHIPLGEVEERIGELDTEKEYYMICRSGRRSEMSSGILESNNIAATNVEGGMLAWNGETIA
ncbi:rhodanese-like domain-containing protein [Planococcus sp. PAMC 21323]|uniref:rhodanese-like domain-containing protein n=1 Tax=Planococcus sp. PAMC 21323 TaxID=1526927 RepID=UPI000570C081|nr:rhodanese-like domain-containing protein [Planococcus sp. PAMC 21323]AIY05814.1 rhodanese-like domain-containing protein [Planococcus sp. PAMC 21323]